MNPAPLTDLDREMVRDRILGAALRCFERRGVEATEMREIAAEAGISRATLYRYFSTRDELQTAYAHRRAFEVAAAAFSAADLRQDLDVQIVEVILAAVRAVRADPILAARFQPPNIEAGLAIGARSEVVSGIAATFFSDLAPEDRELAAAWTMRVVLMMLVLPADDATEQAMVERFVGVAFRQFDRARRK